MRKRAAVSVPIVLVLCMGMARAAAGQPGESRPPDITGKITAVSDTDGTISFGTGKVAVVSTKNAKITFPNGFSPQKLAVGQEAQVWMVSGSNRQAEAITIVGTSAAAPPATPTKQPRKAPTKTPKP